MREFPKGGILGKVYYTVKWASGFRVGLYAAHASFFIVLSLFPSLILILGILRNAGLQAESLLSVLEGFVPEVLFPAVQKSVRAAYRNTTGTVLGISALSALWSASRGIYGLVTGLNAIYGVRESRGYFYTRAVCVGYMFAFLGLLILTLVIHVFGNTILQAFPKDIPFIRFLDEVVGLRFLLLLLLQTGLFIAMFIALPNDAVHFTDALPGSVLAALGWLLFSRLYSVYVERFSVYAGIYDSVYTMMIGMLWLYFCISIVFYGGVLNHWFRNRKILKENSQ